MTISCLKGATNFYLPKSLTVGLPGNKGKIKKHQASKGKCNITASNT